MVITLGKKLNLFVPAPVSTFESFKDSFDVTVDSAVLKDVDADEVRKRILAKRPDLEGSISDFMPSNEELAANGEEMKDIDIVGVDIKGNHVSRTISLNRLLSYDKKDTFNNVHRIEGRKWVLSISSITYDSLTKTVTFE